MTLEWSTHGICHECVPLNVRWYFPQLMELSPFKWAFVLGFLFLFRSYYFSMVSAWMQVLSWLTKDRNQLSFEFRLTLLQLQFPRTKRWKWTFSNDFASLKRKTFDSGRRKCESFSFHNLGFCLFKIFPREAFATLKICCCQSSVGLNNKIS